VSQSLGDLLRALQSAGLSLDAEGARDSLWLALRIAERQNASGVALGEARGDTAGAPRPGPDGEDRETGAAADSLEEVLRIAGEAGAAVPVRRLRLASPPSLPGSRTLGRAFQPLRRETPSPSGFFIDMEETVRRAAEEDLWVPVLRPAPERWLSLALVVERSLSMAVFQGVVRELRRALRWSGAFRDFRVWWLDAEGGEARVYARPRDAVQRVGSRRLREIPGTGRRSLVLVLSDCVSDGWYDGRILSALAAWCRSVPVALLQALPERMWPRTALGEGARVRLRASAEAQTNGHLRWIPELPDPFLPTSGGLLLPTASLEAASLRPLARLIAGQGTSWMPGFLFDIEEQQVLGPPAPAPQAGAAECVRSFFALSSTQAVRLASLLAASPVLSLGILRLLRRDLVADAGPVHEAEVLLGGILRVRGAEGAGPLDPESVQIEFLEGVRPLLLDNAPAGDVLRVLERAVRLAESPGLEASSFELLLTDPEAATLNPDEASPFAQQAAEILERLGGPYTRAVHGHSGRGGLREAPAPQEPAQSQAAPRVAKEARPRRVWQPWVLHPLPEVKFLVGRNGELMGLRMWWEEPDQPSVCALTGPGGIGKTALATVFLQSIVTDSEGGYFVWSFDEEPSVARFIQQAWAYFTDSTHTPLGDEWTDLVHALRSGERHILVLDGIEASQADDQPGSGLDALRSLLHEASLGPSRLRALVTCRNDEIPREWMRIALDGLAPAEALELFEQHGVPGPNEELLPFISWAEGHPLSLSLIAGFLRTRGESGLAALRDLVSLPPRDPRALKRALNQAAYAEADGSHPKSSADPIVRESRNEDVMRDKVFISYSRADEKLMKELLKHLKPFSRSGVITAWSDEQIAAGSRWLSEIQAALERTSVAVLLVSPDFLASDFIHERELGPLLKGADAGGVRILWVPLRPSAYEETPLERYQAVSSPDEPLSQMSKAGRDKAWVRICKEIKRAVNP
jgi:hypothetical protein